MSNEKPKVLPCRKSDLEAYMKLADECVKQSIDSNQECRAAEENMSANRHNSAVPFDYNRVKLRGDKDYINASWIEFASLKRKFIVTQAPLSDTRVHFWRMMTQNSVKSIIMLTHLDENKTNYCSNYFPCSLNDAIVYSEGDNISIRLTKLESRGCYFIRYFIVRQSNEVTTVRQFHFLNWWKIGLTGPASLLHFIKHLWIEKVLDKKEVVAIHGCDGSSRSLLFLLIETSLTRMIESRKADPTIVFDTLCDIKKQRKGFYHKSSPFPVLQCMILLKDVMQMLEPAEFNIHRMNISFNLQKRTAAEAIRSKVDNINHNWESHRRNVLHQQFDSRTANYVDKSPSKNQALRHASLNRNRNILPFDFNLVPKLTEKNRDTYQYYNASNIFLSLTSKRFVIGQAPLPAQVYLFWSIILASKPKFNGIIMLNDCTIPAKLSTTTQPCDRYYPIRESELFSVKGINGDINVHLDKVHEGTYFDVHYLTVNGQSVKHFHYKKWQTGCGTDSAQLLNFIRTIWYEGLLQNPQSQVFIHSAAGGGRCGCFAIVDYCLQYILDNHNLREDIVELSMSEIIKYRISLLESEEQLEFCYKTVLLAWAALSESCFDLQMTNFLR